MMEMMEVMEITLPDKLCISRNGMMEMMVMMEEILLQGFQ
jgi:hypothetical protein